MILIGAALAVGVLTACTTSRAGYESAAYEAKMTDGSFELREYPEFSIASTKDGGDGDQAFMRLFRYIGGANEAEQKIAMTTPVFMDESAGGKEMSFVLPKDVAAAPAAKAPAACRRAPETAS